MSSPDGLRRLLIVEPDTAFRDLLQRVAASNAEIVVDTAGDIHTAYARLRDAPPELLITNLRLRGWIEGLQLAYDIAKLAVQTRAIVYGKRTEQSIIREIQRVCGFYERQSRVQFALPAYLNAHLPARDRRDPGRLDRRRKYRGGRRASDAPLISVWGSE